MGFFAVKTAKSALKYPWIQDPLHNYSVTPHPD